MNASHLVILASGNILYERLSSQCPNMGSMQTLDNISTMCMQALRYCYLSLIGNLHLFDHVRGLIITTVTDQKTCTRLFQLYVTEINDMLNVRYDIHNLGGKRVYY